MRTPKVPGIFEIVEPARLWWVMRLGGMYCIKEVESKENANTLLIAVSN